MPSSGSTASASSMPRSTNPAYATQTLSDKPLLPDQAPCGRVNIAAVRSELPVRAPVDGISESSAADTAAAVLEVIDSRVAT
jgi:hypothetical protein